MPVFLEDIRISNEFRPETTDWLLANILERVTIEVDFRVETFFITRAADPDDAIEIAVPTQLTPDWLEDVSGANRFENFYVGDTFSITNSPTSDGFYTITEKLNNGLVRVTPVPPNNELAQGTTFLNTTPQSGVRFQPNFIENNAPTSYNSLTTGQDQLFIFEGADGTNTTFQAMVPANGVEWVIGGARIKGKGAVNSYTIEWDTWLSPFFLEQQINDLKSLIAPNYYNNANALKYIFRVDVAPDLTDPNRLQSIEIDEILGNTGWLNERFNGGRTNYSVTAPNYTLVSDSSTVDSIQLVSGDQTQVTFIVNNTTDSPFTATSQLISNFIYLPESDNYIGTGENLRRNYFFDRVTMLADGSVNAGENLATDRQIILSGKADLLTPDSVMVTLVIDLNAAPLGFFSSETVKDYLLTVNTQDETLTSELSDRVQLSVDINEFFLDITREGIIDGTIEFLEHDNASITENNGDTQYMSEDVVTVKSSFLFDRTDSELLNSVNAVLVAEKTTGERFELERFNIDMTSTQVVNGAQFIEFEHLNSFNIPQTEDIRRYIRLDRDTTIDSGTQYGYLLQYPFQVRWEYWIAKLGVSTDFFNVSEPNNGYNEEWHRYDNPSDWSIKFILENVIDNSGSVYISETENELELFDYDNNDKWDNEVVQTQDPDTTPLSVGSDNAYYGNDLTRIFCTFDKVSGVEPDVSNIYFIIRVEVFEQGGVNKIWSLSNLYNREAAANPLEGETASGLVQVVKVGNQYQGSCLLDGSKLPLGAKIKISSRIKEIA